MKRLIRWLKTPVGVPRGLWLLYVLAVWMSGCTAFMRWSTAAMERYLAK